VARDYLGERTLREVTMAAKKGGRRKYGKAAGKSVESAMRRRKRGTLKSGKGGKGGKVKSRKQAIAIGLSEAREKGAKVPRKRTSKKGGRKAAKKGGRKAAKKGGRKRGARKRSR
jgi:hypothetical protein